MTGFSSYSLKTVVMLMIRENPKEKWENSDKPKLFLKVRISFILLAILKRWIALQALEYLQSQLEKGMVPYYFDKGHDVTGQLGATKKKSAAGYLAASVKKLRASMDTEQCSDVWRGYFKACQ